MTPEVIELIRFLTPVIFLTVVAVALICKI